MMKSVQHALLILLTLAVTVITGTAGAEVTYFHHDALGSTVAATDESGTVLWREAYQPYGERLDKAVSTDEHSTYYTGKPHDDRTGLTYFGARHYDPVVGRFMGMDPVGVDPGNIHSFNRYAYANNNPYKYVDNDGNTATLAWCFGGPAACVAGVSLALLTAIAADNAIKGTQEAIRQYNESNSSDNNSGDSSDSDGESEEPAKPAPAVPNNPWHPSEVDKRRSDTRRNEGAPSLDPDSPIPDRGPGSDQGDHDARNRTPHDTGERNVNRHEEHSRVPKRPRRY